MYSVSEFVDPLIEWWSHMVEQRQLSFGSYVCKQIIYENYCTYCVEHYDETYKAKPTAFWTRLKKMDFVDRNLEPRIHCAIHNKRHRFVQLIHLRSFSITN